MSNGYNQLRTKNKKETSPLNNKIMKKIVLALITFGFAFTAQAQDNPYEIFGHETKVTYETSVKDYLYIENNDTSSITQAIAFDFENGKVLFLDKTDSIIGKISIDPSQLYIWLSVDPLSNKYPQWSPYAFVFNNPLKYIDPDGREGIVVTGGEYNSESRYKYNFVETSINQLNQMVSQDGDEPITWAVMTAGYSQKDLQKFQAVADKLGVNMVQLKSADELTNYVNSKSTGSSDLSQARQDDQVTQMAIFGHGFSGSAEFGYNQGAETQENFSWGMDDASNLSSGAFNNATINFFTCNAATDSEGGFTGNSLIRTVANSTNSTVSGYWGRTDYATINIGEDYSDKLNRAVNGFNTNGSQSLPSPGTKSTGETSTKVTLTR